VGLPCDRRVRVAGDDALEFVYETLFSDLRGVFPVPLGTLSPVPLTLAGLIAAGHLAILEARVRTKPASANTARTFAAGHGFLHRCLSLYSGQDNDSMPIPFYY
jgi:hypothetical protein